MLCQDAVQIRPVFEKLSRHYFYAMDKTRYASFCVSKCLEKYEKIYKIEGCTNICIFFIQESEHIYMHYVIVIFY